MIQRKLAHLLLLPFALLYGMGISIRNALYQWGIIRAVSFNIPVIGVGNLTLGGAGKTPHVEYMIRFLNPFIELATLSRGYKRKTRGFRIVKSSDSALEVGDEPLQYHLKYPDVHVAVSESRSIGIPLLLNQFPKIQAIVLDDSYQHLSVRPGLNILLTEFNQLYTEDFLLPAGRLREWPSASSRADVIIVTKCPDQLDTNHRNSILASLRPNQGQSVYFSKYVYGSLYSMSSGNRLDLSTFEEVLLVTGIANESYLLDHIETKVAKVHTMSFEDHHLFSPHEVSNIKLAFENMAGAKKAIITTEKDATRLLLHKEFIRDNQLPIFILPLKVSFLDDDGVLFNQKVKDFLLNFKA